MCLAQASSTYGDEANRVEISSRTITVHAELMEAINSFFSKAILLGSVLAT